MTREPRREGLADCKRVHLPGMDRRVHCSARHGNRVSEQDDTVASRPENGTAECKPNSSELRIRGKDTTGQDTPRLELVSVEAFLTVGCDHLEALVLRDGGIRADEQGIVANSRRVPDSIEFGAAGAHGVLLPLVEQIEEDLGRVKVHKSSAWSRLRSAGLEGLREFRQRPRCL